MGGYGCVVCVTVCACLCVSTVRRQRNALHWCSSNEWKCGRELGGAEDSCSGHGRRAPTPEGRKVQRKRISVTTLGMLEVKLLEDVNLCKKVRRAVIDKEK